MKKPVLKNFAIFTVKLQACFPTKVFSSEYCEIFTNTYFEEHLLTAADFSDFLKTATEQRWAAASVLTLLLSSDNLLRVYEQSSY